LHHVTQLHQRGNIAVPMHAARQHGPVAPRRLVLPKELVLQIYFFSGLFLKYYFKIRLQKIAPSQVQKQRSKTLSSL
jgi:hypothetical protein